MLSLRNDSASGTDKGLGSFGTGLTEPYRFHAQFPQSLSEDHLDFNNQGKMVIGCLIKAVDFASVLAFTNWGVLFRAMSVGYLQTAWDFIKPHSLLSTDIVHRMLTERDFASFNLKDWISYALEPVTAGSLATEISDFADSSKYLMATTINGVVIVRSTTVGNSANLSQPVSIVRPKPL